MDRLRLIFLAQEPGVGLCIGEEEENCRRPCNSQSTEDKKYGLGLVSDADSKSWVCSIPSMAR